MNFEDDISLYDEIGEVMKTQLNKPRTRKLTTSLPSLEEQKNEIFDRKKLKEKVEKKIKDSEFITPPLDSDFINYAMKKYIEMEYPSEEKEEVDYIIEKYVGKKREEIPSQFEYVVSGEEKKMLEKLKSRKFKIDEKTVEHIMNHGKEAIEELKSFESRKKKNTFLPEVSFLSLAVEIYGYSIFNVRTPIKLAHSFNRLEDSQICFVYENKKSAEDIRKKMELESFNYQLLDFEDLEEYERDSEKLKLFLESYDFVVVDECLRYLLYDYGLNDHLQNEKKLVLSSKQNMVESAKENLESSVFSILKYSNNASVRLGLIEQKASELLENLENVIRFLLSTVSESQVRSFQLSVKNSPKLFVFKNYANPIEKESKKFKKRKRQEFEDLETERNEDQRPEKKRKVE